MDLLPMIIGISETRPSSLPFSSFNTPLGHTEEQTPQPTQEALTIFCPRWAYQRTSMPISQYVEQLPQDMHCPPLVVIRKRLLNLWTMPR